MISGANMLLKDLIMALSLRNMLLSIGKIGHEGPSIVLEHVEHWFEFAISTDFHDLKAAFECNIYYSLILYIRKAYH